MKSFAALAKIAAGADGGVAHERVMLDRAGATGNLWSGDMPRGRPIELNDRLQSIVCRLVSEGKSLLAAAQSVRIGKTTLYRWMSQGKSNSVRCAIYREFREAIKKAEADAENKMVEIITKAARKHWTAAAWWLERRHHGRWGLKPRQAMRYQGGEDGPVEVVRTIEVVQANGDGADSTLKPRAEQS
jgi:transposase